MEEKLKSQAGDISNEAIDASKASGLPVSIDPTRCRVFAGNGRAETKFDPVANAALVEDIRTNGQVTSVLVRPVGDGYEVIAGTRRLGAILEIRKTEPSRELKAFVAPMPDEKAWEIADKENANRRDLTPIQRARTWSYAINKFHGGCQKTFAQEEGLQETAVSRTLRLLDVPAAILAALKNPEAVSVNFATDLFRFLPAQEDLEKAEITAQNLAKRGVFQSPATLLDALCSTPAEIAKRTPTFVAFSGVEQHASVKANRDGSLVLAVKRIDHTDKNVSARKELLKALHQELKKLLLPETMANASKAAEAQGDECLDD